MNVKLPSISDIASRSNSVFSTLFTMGVSLVVGKFHCVSKMLPSYLFVVNRYALNN